MSAVDVCGVALETGAVTEIAAVVIVYFGVVIELEADDGSDVPALLVAVTVNV